MQHGKENDLSQCHVAGETSSRIGVQCPTGT